MSLNSKQADSFYEEPIVTLFGVPIDDHFWPSIYPGLFIGAIYGLSARGLVNILAATLGGMTGAIAAFLVIARSGVEDGLLPLAFLIATSFVGAYLFVAATAAIQKSRAPGNQAR